MDDDDPKREQRLLRLAIQSDETTSANMLITISIAMAAQLPHDDIGKLAASIVRDIRDAERAKVLKEIEVAKRGREVAASMLESLKGSP